MSDELRAQYPGVDSAFSYVMPSYEWMLTRLEAADTRIQAIQAFAVSFTFGVPALAKALSVTVAFDAGRFYFAIACFVVLMIVGVLAQARGAVKLANPALFYTQWLHFSDWEFKKNAIYFAGQHFETNGALIQRKATASIVMTVLFLMELLFLFSWLVTP
jgi:hypothetical protein